MEAVRELVAKAFAIDSIWSVVLRGVIWFAIALVIIVSVDATKDEENVGSNLKTNLGFFFLFIILSGGLIYLLFGYTSQG